MEKKQFGRRITAMIVVVVLAVGTLFACGNGEQSAKSETLILWYTQEEMKTYLENAAKAYKEKTGIAVQCVYRDSKQYMEDIYHTSLNDEEGAPDVYLLRHDRLGRACMQGIAAANVSDTYSEENYCATALKAASYQDKLMAYPFYYNTACMIYNTDYFQEAPVTMGAITAFSETAEIGENVQNILYWDINDYFCNYPFIGAYLNIEESGGTTQKTAGEKNAAVADERMAQCLQSFQNLGQYFAIDSDSINKKDVPAALMEGRTLCILADSDMVHIVNWYAANHGVQIPYHISSIPDVSDDLKSCEGSYTELAVVNGMSLKQDIAADFTEFLTSDYVQNLYGKAGHFPAKAGIQYDNKELAGMYEIYKQSKPLPKLLETEDLSVNLEVLFANVWDGSDIATELAGFTDKIELRLNK